MKKALLLLTTAAALALTTAHAQTTPRSKPGTSQRMQQGTPEQRATMQTQRLTRQLGLSAEQQTKVQAIYLAQANEASAARTQATSGNANRGDMRQKMQEGRARLDAQLQEVLTAEQYAKYEQQRQDRGEGHRTARPGKKTSKAS